MFEPNPPIPPRVFAQDPPGVDFPIAVVAGLIERFKGHPPEALARVELYVNTARMQRRIRSLLDDGPPARLLPPRIRLVTDLARDPIAADIPPAVTPLRRRLELAGWITQLLDAQPDLAPPRAAIYDLADSLAKLMDEMQGEGVSPDAIRGGLDVSDQSGHWARSLTFISAVDRFFGPDSGEAPPDSEARQRLVIERLAKRWAETPPPDHPVIVAGSTGSRGGATGLFMQAVAKLPPQGGALILPGFDPNLPENTWDQLDDALSAEDHPPQYRYAHLMRLLNLRPGDIRPPWTGARAPSPARNRLVSLALRPAPVTDQWQVEGPPTFEGGVTDATQNMTLIEAPPSPPRAEASAIATALRKAAEDGHTAALITPPDRALTRQVTAALDRWGGIVPDDSAGRPPLPPLTAPGRFLRHVADLFGQRLTAPALLTLLKHPLTNTGSGARGDHLRHTRDLELDLLRQGLPFPTPPADLDHWAAKKDDRPAWAKWVGQMLCGHDTVLTRSLTDHITHHLTLAEALCAGPETEGSGALWEEQPGREALRVVGQLAREAEHGGDFTPPSDYRDLFQAVLNTGMVRDAVTPHPNIMIWGGTLEARVQGADLVILAGLNDGTWPEMPAADPPWMNRKMRHDAGLLLPERRVGLSAHDFQQAIGAKQVILTRAIRDAESETVPSRWINRLTNLLAGMSEEGKTALEDMRARGATWLKLSQAIEAPPKGSIPPEKRPSPCPPVAHRPPDQLSVTRIAKLIRDPPYAIYAERILGLRPLQSLHQTPPDAPPCAERFCTRCWSASSMNGPVRMTVTPSCASPPKCWKTKPPPGPPPARFGWPSSTVSPIGF